MGEIIERTCTSRPRSLDQVIRLVHLACFGVAPTWLVSSRKSRGSNSDAGKMDQTWPNIFPGELQKTEQSPDFDLNTSCMLSTWANIGMLPVILWSNGKFQKVSMTKKEESKTQFYRDTERTCYVLFLKTHYYAVTVSHILGSGTTKF